MCEKCPPPPPPMMPVDAEAVRLAGELIARCQALLPPDAPDAARDARNLLISASTFCRNAMMAHMGRVRPDDLIRAYAHLSATEIHGQASSALKDTNAPMPAHLLMTQAIADRFSEHVVETLADLQRRQLDVIFTPPGPRKEAS